MKLTTAAMTLACAALTAGCGTERNTPATDQQVSAGAGTAGAAATSGRNNDAVTLVGCVESGLPSGYVLRAEGANAASTGDRLDDRYRLASTNGVEVPRYAGQRVSVSGRLGVGGTFSGAIADASGGAAGTGGSGSTPDQIGTAGTSARAGAGGAAGTSGTGAGDDQLRVIDVASITSMGDCSK